MRSALEHFVGQGRLAASIYYDWAEIPGKPDSWAIFRCGSLTDAGKLALSPLLLKLSAALPETGRIIPRLAQTFRGWGMSLAWEANDL